ncbi:MAG: hypothetical protein JXO51_02290 [Candidatus Aminicenantes bacterium]|nr:hypothetical protein [Candidatus Aminicenantes bacterium]
MKRKRTIGLVAIFALLGAALGAQTITMTSPNGGERWFSGDPVTITWTCSGVSGDVRLLLMRSDGSSVGIIAAAVPAAVGSFSWTAGTTASGAAPAGEDYVVRVRGVGTDLFDRSDAPFALVSRLPNIHVGSMREIGWDHTFTPRTFTAGDAVTIKYYLRNDSAYSAGPFHVGLRVGGAIIARNAHAGLVNGDEGNGQFTWTATCGSPVAVVGDCDNEVSENNEGDNVMTDPDLACSQTDLLFFRDLSCSSGSTTVKAGLRYNFSAQVDAVPTRADNVRVIGGVVGGTRLYDHTFPSMAGDGGLEEVSFIWEVPEGAHRVYFEIDPDNTVAESNERNNRQELALTGVVSTPATETYDLRLKVTQPRLFGVPPGGLEAKAGAALTVRGEMRGATGAIRDFKVSAWVQSKTSRATRIFEQDFNDPGMLVVPFSFTWTPSAVGLYSIRVEVELGPHAVSVGVVDSNPRNNSVSFKVNVIPARPTLKR